MQMSINISFKLKSFSKLDKTVNLCRHNHFHIRCANKGHLHDLVSLLHPVFIRRAVWLDSTYKDPNVVASHESKTQTALLYK